MARKVVALALFLAFLTAPGVRAEPIGKSDQEVRGLAEPILEGILAGFNQGDYQLYSRNFDDSLKEAIPEKKFHQIREDLVKKFGTFQKKTYLGFLTQRPYTVVLWKGSFAGTPDDILLRLVLSRRQETIKVMGLWFQ